MVRAKDRRDSLRLPFSERSHVTKIFRLSRDWLHSVLFFSIEVAKQLAKTSQDIFFITSGAESSKEERDKKKGKKIKRKRKKEKKFRQLTFIGSHNFINSAEIWERDFKKKKGGGRER